MPGDDLGGPEFSIGVVALEELDLATSTRAVPAAARMLSDAIRHQG
jgi:hypothetical protein